MSKCFLLCLGQQMRLTTGLYHNAKHGENSTDIRESADVRAFGSSAHCPILLDRFVITLYKDLRRKK